MKVEQWDIDRLTPYENNPRKNDDAVEYVANSIREFGFQQPIVVDSEGVIIVGHTRLKAAQKLGLETVPVAVADDLTPNQIDAYRLADNKTNEFAEWDFEKLNEELEAIDWLDVDMEQFGFSAGGGLEDDNPYNSEVNGLIYEPSDEKPSIFDLADIKKMMELTDDIEQSNLPPEEKEFLRLAAMRHIVFDYGKIADYYAHADEDMRAFMERSFLVIVDYDKAIEQGFVKMKSDIESVFDL